MKFAFALTLLSGLLLRAHGWAADQCTEQDNCIHFTRTLVPGDDCGGSWYYEICLFVDLVSDSSCKMFYDHATKADDTFVHICEKDSDCHSDQDVSDSNYVGSVGHGHRHCQKVAPGARGEFILRDGGSTTKCGPATSRYFGDVLATCQQHDSASCHNGNLEANYGNECMWTIDAPDTTAPACGVRTRMNFWGRTRGEYITDQFKNEFGVRVWTTGSGCNSEPNSAQIFDSNIIGNSQDADLGSPNERCDICATENCPGELVGNNDNQKDRAEENQPDMGLSNCEKQNNMLIIPEKCGNQDPDDQGAGGTINFEFEKAVDLHILGFMDVDGEEMVSIRTIDLKGNGDTWKGDEGARLTGENGFTIFPYERNEGYDPEYTMESSVVQLQLKYTGSGSVSYFDYTMECDNEDTPTCPDQDPCVDFTVSKKAGDVCSGECEYEICIKANFAGSCAKTVDTAIFQYACQQDYTNFCKTTAAEFNGEISVNGEDEYIWDKIYELPSDYEYCQTVPAGGTAEFLLKDGNAGFNSDDCGTATKSFGTMGLTATCATGGRHGCGGSARNDGNNCVWTVDAPADCNSNGGGGGDPHIKRWNRKRSTFHGECDLVLVHSDKFHDEAGLDLHIRTTIVDHYSYIEMAALRVGEYVLEAHESGFYLGERFITNGELPMSFGGKYTLYPFTIDEISKWKGARIYKLDLGDDSHILFKWYKHFLTVDVSGHPADFGDSTGLIGQFETGAMFSRGGDAMRDFDAYGLEWQVNEADPKLFRVSREPQLPHATCTFPTEERDSRRLRNTNYRLFEQAKEACAHHDADDRELCIDDVLAVGDVGLASVW